MMLPGARAAMMLLGASMTAMLPDHRMSVVSAELFTLTSDVET